MARLKSEFLNAWHERHGLPLRSRLFGNLGTLSRAGSRIAPLVNTVGGWGWTRRLSEVVLGVARERALPSLARRRFSQWFAEQETAQSGDEVVLFLDTYTETMAPEIGIAAVEVLAAAGCKVVLAEGQGCCGRPMISKGMLRQARNAAARNLDALGAYAEDGVPIVGLEPSCLLTLRDEYLEFFPSDNRARMIAGQAVLIEEYMVRPGADGTKPIDRLTLDGPPRDITLHGHCYTKSLVGSAPMLEMLGRISTSLEDIPSGCCGMAGSFGYEREHYNLSRQIGELALLPAVREAAASGRVIAAAGTSCRGQILDGTGRRALHPIEVVASRLGRPPGSV
jgi:Fe-S oxidoreductase